MGRGYRKWYRIGIKVVQDWYKMRFFIFLDSAFDLATRAGGLLTA